MKLFDWFRSKPVTPEIRSEAGWNGLKGIFPFSQQAPINEQNALALSAVYCACNVIANAFAGLPAVVYRHTDQGKLQAPDHYLWDLLNHNPNDDMTSYVFRHTAMHHALIWSDSYSQIVFDGAGRPAKLLPLLPNRVTVMRETGTGELIYHVWTYPQNEVLVLRQYEMFHVPGLSFEGVRGMPLIMLARQSLELTRNAEEHGAKYFRNAATPSGWIEYPNALSDQARNNLRASFRLDHQGSQNAGSVPVLEEGAKFTAAGQTNEQGQYNQTRQYQIAEVARWFNVSPVFLHELGRATWSNLEQLNTIFVQQTLLPWAHRWEHEIKRKLLINGDKQRFFVEFDVDKLLRGDVKTRYAVYSQALQNGILSINEVREKEHMNPIDGGDEHRIQVNLVGADEVPDEDAPQDQAEGVANNADTEEQTE